METTNEKVYRIMENIDWEIFTRYFHNLENAEKFLNENVTDINWKKLWLNFDNWTWSLYEIVFED